MRFPILATRPSRLLMVLLLCVIGLISPLSLHAAKKKKPDAPAAPVLGPRKFAYDPTKLVWPSPPNIGRVHWMDYVAGAKIDYTQKPNTKPKASWMDRL